jgi:thiol-disulfide isomerase/thioredoxin
MGPQEVALGVGLLLIVLWLVYRTYLSQEYTREGFNNMSATTVESHSFVMYYADWCGHCKTTKPEFAKLGSTKTIGGKSVKVSAINADENPELLNGREIRGYPTIHLYDPKGQLVQEYSGQRTAQAFEKFLNQNVK